MRSIIFTVILASVAASLVQTAPVKNSKRQEQKQQPGAGGGFGPYITQGITATNPLTTGIYSVVDPPTGSAAVAQGGVEGVVSSTNPLSPSGISPTIDGKTAMAAGAGTFVDGVSNMVAGGGTGTGGGGQQEP